MAASRSPRLADNYARTMGLRVIGTGMFRTGATSLKAALDVPVPDIDFFHQNTTAEFRSNGGLDQ